MCITRVYRQQHENYCDLELSLCCTCCNDKRKPYVDGRGTNLNGLTYSLAVDTSSTRSTQTERPCLQPDVDSRDAPECDKRAQTRLHVEFLNFHLSYTTS